MESSGRAEHNWQSNVADLLGALNALDKGSTDPASIRRAEVVVIGMLEDPKEAATSIQRLIYESLRNDKLARYRQYLWVIARRVASCLDMEWLVGLRINHSRRDSNSNGQGRMQASLAVDMLCLQDDAPGLRSAATLAMRSERLTGEQKHSIITGVMERDKPRGVKLFSGVIVNRLFGVLSSGTGGVDASAQFGSYLETMTKMVPLLSQERCSKVLRHLRKASKSMGEGRNPSKTRLYRLAIDLYTHGTRGKADHSIAKGLYHEAVVMCSREMGTNGGTQEGDMSKMSEEILGDCYYVLVMLMSELPREEVTKLIPILDRQVFPFLWRSWIGSLDRRTARQGESLGPTRQLDPSELLFDPIADDLLGVSRDLQTQHRLMITAAMTCSSKCGAEWIEYVSKCRRPWRWLLYAWSGSNFKGVDSMDNSLPNPEDRVEYACSLYYICKFIEVVSKKLKALPSNSGRDVEIDSYLGYWKVDKLIGTALSNVALNRCHSHVCMSLDMMDRLFGMPYFDTQSNSGLHFNGRLLCRLLGMIKDKKNRNLVVYFYKYVLKMSPCMDTETCMDVLMSAIPVIDVEKGVEDNLQFQQFYEGICHIIRVVCDGARYSECGGERFYIVDPRYRTLSDAIVRKIAMRNTTVSEKVSLIQVLILVSKKTLIRVDVSTIANSTKHAERGAMICFIAILKCMPVHMLQYRDLTEKFDRLERIDYSECMSPGEVVDVARQPSTGETVERIATRVKRDMICDLKRPHAERYRLYHSYVTGCVSLAEAIVCLKNFQGAAITHSTPRGVPRPGQGRRGFGGLEEEEEEEGECGHVETDNEFKQQKDLVGQIDKSLGSLRMKIPEDVLRILNDKSKSINRRLNEAIAGSLNSRDRAIFEDSPMNRFFDDRIEMVLSEQTGVELDRLDAFVAISQKCDFGTVKSLQIAFHASGSRQVRSVESLKNFIMTNYRDIYETTGNREVLLKTLSEQLRLIKNSKFVRGFIERVREFDFDYKEAGASQIPPGLGLFGEKNECDDHSGTQPNGEDSESMDSETPVMNSTEQSWGSPPVGVVKLFQRGRSVSRRSVIKRRQRSRNHRELSILGDVRDLYSSKSLVSRGGAVETATSDLKKIMDRLKSQSDFVMRLYMHCEFWMLPCIGEPQETLDLLVDILRTVKNRELVKGDHHVSTSSTEGDVREYWAVLHLSLLILYFGQPGEDKGIGARGKVCGNDWCGVERVLHSTEFSGTSDSPGHRVVFTGNQRKNGKRVRMCIDWCGGCNFKRAFDQTFNQYGKNIAASMLAVYNSTRMCGVHASIVRRALEPVFKERVVDRGDDLTSLVQSVECSPNCYLVGEAMMICGTTGLFGSSPGRLFQGRKCLDVNREALELEDLKRRLGSRM